MKIHLVLPILIFSLISCNTKTETNSENEKKLLEKELELTKRELEIVKKENTKAYREIDHHQKEIPTFDYGKPEQIVEAIIYAAKNKDFDVLYNLCDPQEKGDIVSLCLCRLSSKYKSEYGEGQNCIEITTQEFITLFKRAKNPTTIVNDGMYATVEYKVENLDVKMEMVKRKSRWYIFTLTSPERGE